ncbi:malectin domain-containing carbohydrate-binding protein, partial [Planctomycetota bacterium]
WFVDGKPVYSTMRRGNTVYPYEADNHIFSVKLSAGRHVITALAKAGGESWTLFSLGGDDLTEWLHKMHKPYAPPRRLSILSGDWDTLMLPPYFASLITAEDLSASGLVNKKGSLKEIFRMLRPYGGMACIPVPEDKISDIKGWKQVLHAELAEFTFTDIDFSIKRKGAPKGSAEWTHQYADSANSVISKDKRVKLPLGLLWFGGPSNDAILPRHGHGPSPQVAGGRLFIEGENLLRALDVYTGRLLWEKNMPGIGWYYRHTDHHPGANEIGSNYVSLADGVYLMSPRSCMMLDPATGNTLKEFSLPARKGPKPARWGSIRIWKDLLIATAAPLSVYPLEWLKERGKAKKPVKAEIRQVPIVEQNADYGSASETLVVMNRKSGKILWTRSARYGFRHNAVVAAAGTVFCIDTISKGKLSYLKRRGFRVQTKPVLYALNARTGDVVWESKSNIFGTWLGYSEEHDILLQAGSKGRDRARDEVGQGLAAYKGKDGTVLWQYNEPYAGPCLIYHDMIIIQNRALSLTTGKPLVRKNPVTGTDIPWKFLRTYGCNTVIGSEHLLTFRSAAAGYFDLKDLSGTGNLGGFKSGCTSNLIAADGVLSAPEYTRTCICSYQNQTSLAMIHMPEAEVWTFNDIKWDGTRVKRLGLNFGAPGDRLSDRGTLWLDSPSTGGYSPDVPVNVQGENAQYFRHHASTVRKGDLPWVTASGLTGAGSISITLAEQPKTSQAYTIRLYFADFVNSAAGKRVFDVSIQGKKVLPGFDIIKSAGGAGQGIMKEYKGINVNDQLTIVFKASEGEALVCGVEIIAE